MYEHVKTTKTWAWINAIANSNAQKAIINANGINPMKKNNIPEAIML